jgi:hypothetical protein
VESDRATRVRLEGPQIHRAAVATRAQSAPKRHGNRSRSRLAFARRRAPNRSSEATSRHFATLATQPLKESGDWRSRVRIPAPRLRLLRTEDAEKASLVTTWSQSAELLRNVLHHSSMSCTCSRVRAHLAMVEREIADLEEAAREGDRTIAVELG